MNLFKEGANTGSIFSDILNRYWYSQKEDKEAYILNSDLYKVHELLLQDGSDDIFGKQAEEFYFTYNSLKPDHTEQSQIHCDISNNFVNIDYFKEEGFLFADDMNASAFGHFNYIYRGKGQRTFWFRDRRIIWNNVYVTMDEVSANYSTKPELGVVWMGQNDDKEVKDDARAFTLPNFLKNLTNIQKDYHRAYPLEYIMTPPDVYELCDFSIMLKEELWNIILETAKEGLIVGDTEQLDAFEFFCQLFRELKIDVSAHQILDFVLNLPDAEAEKKRWMIEFIRSQFKGENQDEPLGKSILHCCRKLQNNYAYRNVEENVRNTFLRDIFEERRTDCRIYDQTLRGMSPGGKSAGEVDLYIEKTNGEPCTYIEALNLTSVDSAYIKLHVDKLWKYDTTGLEENYIIIYYDGNNFTKFWTRYLKFVKTKGIFTCKVTKVEEETLQWSEQKKAVMYTERSQTEQKIIHIAVNMNP